jgi:ATP-dependent DNA ligase
MRGTLTPRYVSAGLTQACRRKQTLLQAPAPLTISAFFDTLHKLARMSGQGANARRQAVVAKLLRAARDVETRYLVRTLIQCLRIGAGYRSVLPPLAKAALLHRSMLLDAAASPRAGDSSSGLGTRSAPDPAAAAAAAAAAMNAASSARGISKAQLDAASASVLAAYHRCPNIDIIAGVLMQSGPEALDSQVALSCGVPVKPMLARPCTGPADALKLLSSTAAAGASAVAKGRVKGCGKGGDKPAAAAGAGAAAAAGRSGGAEAEAGAAAGPAGVLPASDEGDESEAEDDAAADSSSDDDEAELPAPVSTAAAAAAGEVVPLVDQQKQGTEAANSSSSGLCVLAEFKYDGQRAQIHVSAEREVRVH